MLDLWYSERCTREIKLIVSILTCAIIYYCATIEKLDPTFTGLSLALGISIHVLRMLALKMSKKNLDHQIVKVIFAVLPIMALAILIYFLPTQNKIFTAIQVTGFTALGLFIVSIYQNRAKRFE